MSPAVGHAESQPTSSLVENWKIWAGYNWPLVLTACFAVVWIFHRAAVQSITLDEATTYLHWVAPNSPAHWEPHSNNHVLNSALMRLAVWMFGLSETAVRAPALAGGVLYIASMFALCMLLASGRVFRISVFLCLVYNPFIMDYLVAARGYGLALGFFAVAMYLLAKMRLDHTNALGERDVLTRITAISACVGLSICASFAFGFASGFLLLVSAGLAALRTTRRFFPLVRLAAASALPALLMLLVFAGSALTDLPRTQLFWGTNSLKEVWHDIRLASFLELNPYLVNPLLALAFDFVKRYLFRAFAIFAITYAVLLYVGRGELRQSDGRSRLGIAGLFALTLLLAILAHWLQFKLFQIPLPFERTSIFVVPLLTASIAAAVAVRPLNSLTRAARGFGIGILLVAGLYFVGELRDSYFREWKECAEIKAAYPIVLDLCRRNGVREIASDLNLTRSFNLYRTLYKSTEIDELPMLDQMPPGKPIYVLLESRNEEFIRSEGLQPVWRGSISDLVIYVKPGMVGTAKP